VHAEGAQTNPFATAPTREPELIRFSLKWKKKKPFIYVSVNRQKTNLSVTERIEPSDTINHSGYLPDKFSSLMIYHTPTV
jgi:hypothetical protein